MRGNVFYSILTVCRFLSKSRYLPPRGRVVKMSVRILSRSCKAKPVEIYDEVFVLERVDSPRMTSKGQGLCRFLNGIVSRSSGQMGEGAERRGRSIVYGFCGRVSKAVTLYSQGRLVRALASRGLYLRAGRCGCYV